MRNLWKGVLKGFSFQIVSPQPTNSHDDNDDDDDDDNGNDGKHALAYAQLSCNLRH